MFCFILLCFLAVYSRLPLNTLCSPGLPQVLGLQACTELKRWYFTSERCLVKPKLKHVARPQEWTITRDCNVFRSSNKRQPHSLSLLCWVFSFFFFLLHGEHLLSTENKQGYQFPYTPGTAFTTVYHLKLSNSTESPQGNCC